MSAAQARTGGAGDDRAALLRRGRQARAVRRADEHLTPAPAVLPEGPERIDPARITGTDTERLAALESALDQAGARAQAGIDMMKAWLDEQRGVVLREIRDAGLYRLKAATFEQYVSDRWQMSRPRAYELIEAAPVLRVLSGIPDTRPAVSQALALAPVYERAGERGVREVVRQAEAVARTEGKRVTAATLKRTVQALGYGPAQVPVQRDDQGPEQEQEQEPDPGEALARARQETAADLQELRAIYDRLGGNGPLLLAGDPGQADAWLREYRQYGNRIAFRAGKLAERTDTAGGEA